MNRSFKQHGYSEESLDMLKSDEGQLNAVFACFGSAAQHAQFFEQALVKFLVVVEKLSSAHDDESFTPSGSRHEKRTMGQLILSVYERVPQVRVGDEEITRYFDGALQRRNFLMHHFFLERGDKLGTREGRFEMLSELLTTENELEACRVAINAMRIALCRATGVEDAAEPTSGDQWEAHSPDSSDIFSYELEGLPAAPIKKKSN